MRANWLLGSLLPLVSLSACAPPAPAHFEMGPCAAAPPDAAAPAVIAGFYDAFSRHDFRGMACSYDPDIEFTILNLGIMGNEVVAAVVGDAMTRGIEHENVIGPDDRLSIVFFKDPDMSADVVVRPDGAISLPLLNEIAAAGLTPSQLRERIAADAKRFMQDPNPTVIVREIHSRRVFITGAVEKPGVYPLNTPMTVLQLIATASGLKDYADSKNIAVLRVEDGKERVYAFNYQEVLARKDLAQDIALKPGDTVLVR